MQLRKYVRPALWFGIPFALMLGMISVARVVLFPPPPEMNALQPKGVSIQSPLQGRVLPVDQLINPKTKASVSATEWATPDSAILILFGGVGCSADQVAVLRDWAELQPDSEWRGYRVLAIYADPVQGEAIGIYESLVLRRVSQVHFPVLVSRDPQFSPRDLGGRTPQVVVAEFGVIAEVLVEEMSIGSEQGETTIIARK